jgi:hypothetical protein
MNTEDLAGSDLLYWVARANLRGSHQERNVLRLHYDKSYVPDPVNEPGMRAFVLKIIGPVLPARGTWQ